MLASRANGAAGAPADADSQTLRAIADASSSTFYSATDPTTISQVLTAVISNF